MFEVFAGLVADAEPRVLVVKKCQGRSYQFSNAKQSTNIRNETYLGSRRSSNKSIFNFLPMTLSKS